MQQVEGLVSLLWLGRNMEYFSVCEIISVHCTLSVSSIWTSVPSRKDFFFSLLDPWKRPEKLTLDF